MSVEIESAALIGTAKLVPGRTISLPARSIVQTRQNQIHVAEAARAISARTQDFARRYGAIVLFLVAWEVAPRLGLVEPSLVPPFSLVVQAWFRMVLSGELLTHIEASIGRSLLGLLLATCVALPLGLGIGWSKSLSESASPLLELFRNTAALALLPVFILLLGIGEASKIALVTYTCSWPILLNTIAGVRNADPLLVKSARTMGVEGLPLFRKVILPASLPSIFVGLRLSAALSVLALIAAEMIGAKAGLGYLVQYAQYNFMVPEMFAGIITISLAGLSLNGAFSLLERRVTSWRPANNQAR